jgi:KDO2-lipid IV(A) lauroyltransferase
MGAFEAMGGSLSLDGAFWRRAARFGARGPDWFARYSPPVIGVVFCVLTRRHRRMVARNLHRVRGRRGLVQDAADVARTFATYASCLSEVLGDDPGTERRIRASVSGERHVAQALAAGRGVIFATAHTAGWDTVGRIVSRDKGLRVMVAEAAERDASARAIQDEVRRGQGVAVTHVGDNPLSALPLVRHLRGGGVVALQIDRTPAGLRSRSVTMFGERSRVPEGPLRLASLTGAPIVPIFSARSGYRRYQVVATPAIVVTRSAGDVELDQAAQQMADAVQNFVRAHPTQWFHFVA